MAHDDLEGAHQLQAAFTNLQTQLATVIVGQQCVIEELLVTLFAGGHSLLVGVPGLAKTLLIRTLSSALALEFRRIQFTPDLMPSDILGTEVIQEDKSTGTRGLRFLPGPIFANVVLADEINRTPPKTQSALLEAMQERQVTVGGQLHHLPQPFFVLATQNPIDQEGTYPLPEAQLDRFMFNTKVEYPDEEEEVQIVQRTTTVETRPIRPVLDGPQILALQQTVRAVPVAEHVVRYAARLVRATRGGREAPYEFVRQYVSWGAGPRASQFLILAAKARAVLQGQLHATIDDVKAVAPAVLRHRVLTNFNAEAEGLTSDDLIRRLLDEVPARTDKSPNRGILPQVFRSSAPGSA